MTAVINDLALLGVVLLLILLVARTISEWRSAPDNRPIAALPSPGMFEVPTLYDVASPDSVTPRRHYTLWALIGLALAARFGTWAFAWLMYMVQENHLAGFWASFRDIWGRWDAVHYIDIADHGYVDLVEPEKLNLVFYPFYPLLVSIAKLGGLSTFTVAVLVSLLAFCAATVLLYKLVERETGNKQLAWDSAKILAIFPFSFFFAMPYSESVFLLLTLAAFWYLRDGRWLAAGVCIAIAGLTRNQGILLGLPFIVEIVLRWRTGRLYNPQDARRGLLLVPLGFITYLCINKYVSGDWFRFFDYQQQNWRASFGYLPANVSGAFNNLFEFDIQLALGTWLPTVICYFAAIALLLASGRKLPLPYLAYSTIYILISYSPSWLMSGPRYLMSLFPLAIATGWLMQRNSFWQQGIQLLMLTGLCFFLVMYLHNQVL